MLYNGKISNNKCYIVRKYLTLNVTVTYKMLQVTIFCYMLHCFQQQNVTGLQLRNKNVTRNKFFNNVTILLIKFC